VAVVRDDAGLAAGEADGVDSSAIEIRSPAVSSMSSSRRFGFGETCFASPRRSSVVSPIAETTTTRS